MWYLHNYFVCARLLALCAIAAPSSLAISDLNNRYARRKDLIHKAKSILHPHSGWFHVSHASRAQQAKALNKKIPHPLSQAGDIHVLVAGAGFEPTTFGL